MNKYPRGIFFKNAKAVGTSPIFTDHCEIVIMHLPSDHYDFLGPINVLGKTKEQIEEEIKQYDNAEN